MAKDAPLYASQEKIKRANSKFRDLVSMVNRYINAGPISIIKKSNPRNDYLIARREKEPPDEFAWELVEAIGHVRSSLDKLVVDLVDLNGRGLSGVGFPFGGMSDGKPEVFPTARHDTLKQKLTPDQWDLILAQKPYPGGNDALWTVNEIANADKHRKGLVTVATAIDSRIAIKQGYIESFRFSPTDANAILDDPKRETVLFESSRGNFGLNVEQHLSITVVFGELPPVTGKNILMTLNQQIRLAESIIKVFRSAFF
jgi:hypothetical protein